MSARTTRALLRDLEVRLLDANAVASALADKNDLHPMDRGSIGAFVRQALRETCSARRNMDPTHAEHRP